MKPPIPVIIIGWLFIVAGTIGFIYHFSELNVHSPFSNDAVLVLVVRLLAVLGGFLLLRGSNVGRWLIVLWMAYHVVLSFFHTISEVIVHLVILAAIVFALFHRRVAAFFNNKF